MATISVRELLRNAKPVFEQMEHDHAPVLITRNGRPFAALVPVDPDHAEAMMLSAAPELIENRNQAEKTGSRRIPLEDLPGEAALESSVGLGSGAEDVEVWEGAAAHASAQSLGELVQALEHAKHIALTLASEAHVEPTTGRDVSIPQVQGLNY